MDTSNQSRATQMIKAKLISRYGKTGKGKWQKGMDRAVHLEEE